jgi:hypothetical protein
MSERSVMQTSDAEIRRLLEERASRAPQIDVTAAVMTTIATDPRQRRAPIALLPALSIDRRVALLAAAAIALLAAVIAIAGSRLLDQRLLVVAPTPLGTTSPAPSELATPVPSVGPPSVPVAIEQIPLGSRETPCCNWFLASDTVGWLSSAWGSTARRFDPLLFRTEDDGRTWARITLPHGSEKATITPIDADTVYLAYDVDAPSTVAVTHDAGRTWRESTVGDELPIELQITADGLWAFGSHVWQSSDDGVSWEDHGFRTRPSGIDTAGERSGLGATWWAYNGQTVGQPFDNRLALSFDGGATWALRSFPVDDAAKAAAQKWVTSARLTASGRVLLAISVDSLDADTGAAYASDDRGVTWQRLPLGRDAGFIHFLDDETWVIPQDPSRYRLTNDGGTTWRDVRASALDALSGHPPAVQSGHEWDLVYCEGGKLRTEGKPALQCPDGVGGILLETFDGGGSWTPVSQ